MLRKTLVNPLESLWNFVLLCPSNHSKKWAPLKLRYLDENKLLCYYFFYIVDYYNAKFLLSSSLGMNMDQLEVLVGSIR